MTIKEKLYKEYVIALNKVNALKGETLIGGDDIEGFFNSQVFTYDSQKYTKKELKTLIAHSKRSYDEEVEKLRVENYFNTEEGKVEKETLLARIEELKNARYECVKRTTEEVDAFIKEWLGEEWGCGQVGISNMEIGIVEKKIEVGSWMVFGHSFNLYYNDYFKKNRFEMNYGCMGSFDILNGSESGELRCKYLLGMATFANDKEKLSKLENMLIAYNKVLDVCEKEISVLSHNLHHPFDKREVA